MIKKIISGCQTGVGRAALDVAIKLGISHGGWVPKGRLAEDGPIRGKYRLKEMLTDSYPKRTEQNVIDSDGTLIISHGKLIRGSAYTRKMAMKHGKPWFHANLKKRPTFQVATIIEEWVARNQIEALNVAGPRSSEDSSIYSHVTVTLERVFALLAAKDDKAEPSDDARETDTPEMMDPPKTVDEALNFLNHKLSLKDKSALAKMPEGELANLYFSFGLYIRNRFFYPRNDKLLESCRQKAMDKQLHWDQAPAVIIKELWKHLKMTHRLKIVK